MVMTGGWFMTLLYQHYIFSIFFTYPFPEIAMALSSKGGAINRLSHSLPASNRGSPGMFGLTINKDHNHRFLRNHPVWDFLIYHSGFFLG